MTEPGTGYVDYLAILEVDPEVKPGEVRKNYKRKMKELIDEIARVEITEDRRARYLLEMAKLNAALCLLRDTAARDVYLTDRREIIDLEARWRTAVASQSVEAEPLRREYDRRLRDFLSKYVDDLMLSAGRDPEAVEASNWNQAHERHASRILRHYRNTLYQMIRERMPYHEITAPRISWDERMQTVAAIVRRG